MNILNIQFQIHTMNRCFWLTYEQETRCFLMYMSTSLFKIHSYDQSITPTKFVSICPWLFPDIFSSCDLSRETVRWWRLELPGCFERWHLVKLKSASSFLQKRQPSYMTVNPYHAIFPTLSSRTPHWMWHIHTFLILLTKWMANTVCCSIHKTSCTYPNGILTLSFFCRQ